MAEYLSPGVYVEEFDSGAKPMEGVGTSTAGFVGLAERGPVEGVPQLVTNFADFRRKYGGYLSENEFGGYRFLAYAVEHFFINGGSRCFISRVAPSDAKCASAEASVMTLKAKNPGMWGNSIRVVISPSSKAKTQIFEVLDTAGGKKYAVKNGAGFNPGDIVRYTDGTAEVINKVVKNQDNILTDKELLPKKIIETCEFTLEVKYDDIVEMYENLSFNVEASNYLEKKLSKSDLIEAAYTGAGETEAPFRLLAEEEAAVSSISFEGGSNGSVAGISASDFIGYDKGAGKRSGMISWLTEIFSTAPMRLFTIHGFRYLMRWIRRILRFRPQALSWVFTQETITQEASTRRRPMR